MLSASSPVTIFAGIAAEPSGRLPPSSSAKLGGDRIWSWVTPRMPLRFIPSFSGCWSAWSRLGPTVPFVPARFSTWQEPHFWAKSFLPEMRSGLLLEVFVHALSSVAAPPTRATVAPARRRERGIRRAMRARTLSTGADRRRPQGRASDRSRPLVGAPLGGGDAPRRDALPRVPLVRHGDERRTGPLAQVVRGLQPRDEPGGEVADGALPDVEGEPR